MKLLHTGDWHLGKRVHGVSVLEDQAYALSALLEQIEAEKPDVIVIAGDIYDRSVPPVEAITLADQFFRKLRSTWKGQVVMISGNHDSPERVGFGRGLLALSDFYIHTTYQDALTPIVLKARGGAVQCFAMPFLEPIVVKSQWEAQGGEWIWPVTQQGLFEHMCTQWEALLDVDVPKLLVAHAFVGAALPAENVDGMIATPGSGEISALGLELSESERPLSIGGHDIVDGALFKDFDYVALGHLHRPQKVGLASVRYAGSLLKYSFSEAKQVKGITWVNLTKEGVDSYQTQIPTLRDLRIIEGTLEQLTQEVLGQGDDYLCVNLTDEGALYEPMRRLRAVYPNCLKMERTAMVAALSEGRGLSGTATFDEGPGFSSLSPEQVFDQFYRMVVGEEPDAAHKDLYRQALVDVLKEGGA